MGCDIHAYLEYQPYVDDSAYWTCFGEIHIGRDYRLFEIMAGVRGDVKKAVSWPKGVPENMSFWTEDAYSLYISDSNRQGACTLETAERWVKEGSSVWLNEQHSKVSHPDWHSHSWLTTKEVGQVVEKYPDNTSMRMIHEAMLACNRPVRLVFWFDN
jgi:hypothetical protein